MGRLRLRPLLRILGPLAPIFLTLTFVYNVVFAQEQTEPVFERVKLTAYCSCSKCCGKWSEANKTAAGVTPKRFFTVAADTSVYPFGTILRIPGIGQVMVQDTGSAVKGFHLDVYFGRDRHQDALRFGVRYAMVEVIHRGGNHDNNLLSGRMRPGVREGTLTAAVLQ